jgi:hypothetical protein
MGSTSRTLGKERPETLDRMLRYPSGCLNFSAPNIPQQSKEFNGFFCFQRFSFENTDLIFYRLPQSEQSDILFFIKISDFTRGQEGGFQENGIIP